MPNREQKKPGRIPRQVDTTGRACSSCLNSCCKVMRLIRMKGILEVLSRSPRRWKSGDDAIRALSLGMTLTANATLRHYSIAPEVSARKKYGSMAPPGRGAAQ